MLLPDTVSYLSCPMNIFLRVYFFLSDILTISLLLRTYTGTVIRIPGSWPDCLESTFFHNWTQWDVIWLYKNHSDFSRLQFLYCTENAHYQWQESLSILCVVILKIHISNPCPPSQHRQSKVIFVVTSSVDFTAGRSRPTFLVSITSKGWCSVQEARIN